MPDSSTTGDTTTDGTTTDDTTTGGTTTGDTTTGDTTTGDTTTGDTTTGDTTTGDTTTDDTTTDDTTTDDTTTDGTTTDGEGGDTSVSPSAAVSPSPAPTLYERLMAAESAKEMLEIFDGLEEAPTFTAAELAALKEKANAFADDAEGYKAGVLAALSYLETGENETEQANQYTETWSEESITVKIRVAYKSSSGGIYNNYVVTTITTITLNNANDGSGLTGSYTIPALNAFVDPSRYAAVEYISGNYYTPMGDTDEGETVRFSCDSSTTHYLDYYVTGWVTNDIKKNDNINIDGSGEQELKFKIIYHKGSVTSNNKVSVNYTVKVPAGTSEYEFKDFPSYSQVGFLFSTSATETTWYYDTTWDENKWNFSDITDDKAITSLPVQNNKTYVLFAKAVSNQENKRPERQIWYRCLTEEGRYTTTIKTLYLSDSNGELVIVADYEGALPAGYKFECWTCGNREYYPGQSLKTDQQNWRDDFNHKIFEPKFVRTDDVLYKVVYNSGKGKWGVNNNSTWEQTVSTTTGSYVVTDYEPAPTRKKYIFDGWYTEENGKGTKITGKQTIEELVKQLGIQPDSEKIYTLNLYANYTPDPAITELTYNVRYFCYPSVDEYNNYYENLWYEDYNQTPEEITGIIDADKIRDKIPSEKFEKVTYSYNGVECRFIGAYIKSDEDNNSELVPLTDQSYGLYGVDSATVYMYYVKADAVVDVTFKVTNGTWSDGTTADKVITIDKGATLDEVMIPSGMKPDDGYTGGSWDKTPDTTNAVNEAVTYTYSFEKEAEGTDEEEGNDNGNGDGEDEDEPNPEVIVEAADTENVEMIPVDDVETPLAGEDGHIDNALPFLFSVLAGIEAATYSKKSKKRREEINELKGVEE